MSSSSPLQRRSPVATNTTANSERKFTVAPVASEPPVISAGSYDDARQVRECLTRSIKNSRLSRAAIAERMSYLLGKTVTDKMLNAFTADRDDRRWPAEWDRAFCAATGDLSLIRERAKLAGLIVITDEEKALLDFGRASIEQKRSAAEMEALERQILGGSE